MIKRKVKLMTIIIMTSVIYSSVNTYTAKAEGSKDMVKNGGYRPYTEWANNTTGGIVRKTLLKVYAKDGETINLGSSVYQNSATDILVRDPSGNSKGYDVTSAGKGYISSVDKETAGVKTSSNPNGYDPITIQVNQTGIWEVEFYGSGGPSLASSNGNKLKYVTDDFVANQANTIGAWDITVMDSNNTPVTGRVFTSYIALFMGANASNRTEKILNSDFYVLTKDGYQYKTSMNGIDPNGFIFFSGNRGIIDKTNNLTLYHSAKYTNNELSAVEGNISVQNPLAPDTETDVTHYVFFNPPSSDLPQNIMPTTAIAPLAATNFNFTGVAGLGNQSELKAGGIFIFNVAKKSSYKLIIHKYKTGEDITKNDWTFDSTVDRVIENTSVSGINTVIWDGKDASGNYCTSGNYSVRLMTKGGEYHFPMLDAEYNPFGIKVELLNPPGSFPSGTNKNTVYYNESNYTAANGTTVSLGASGTTSNPISALLGIDSSNGAYKYTTSYGDWKAVDTWTYFPGDSTYLSFSIDTNITEKGIVSGYVFNDMNSDKAFNGEPGLKGISVSLKNSSGTEIARTTTDSTGLYVFNNIPQNSVNKYKVVVNAPASYTSGSNSCTTGNSTQDVLLNSNSVIAPNVGYHVTTDLQISNVVSQAPYIKNRNITYTLTAKNNSTIDANNVVVNDSLPAGLEYVSSSSDDYDSNIGVWEIGKLSAGETKTLTITAKIKDLLTLPAIITNTAKISCIEPESNTSNNTSSVVINSISENSRPSIGNYNKTIDEDTVLNDRVIGSDSDGDALTYEKDSNPSHGSVSVNSDGSYTYTPNSNYNGSDSFSIKVSDGYGGISTSIVNITINPVNDAPTVSNLSKTGDEDTDITFGNTDFSSKFSDIDNDTLNKVKIATLPSNGVLKLNGNIVSVGNEILASDLSKLVFTPSENWSGNTSFEWNGSDGTAYAELNGRVDITVNPLNDVPVAINDLKTIDEDTSIDINVLENDRDIDGDTLEVIAVTQGSHGTVEINNDGTVKYTPSENYYGPDSFTYTISDGKGGAATATVYITVSPINDIPVANNDTITTDEDTAVDINVLANDSDIDRDTLEVIAVTQGSHGVVTINNDGTVKYTPNANYNGVDSFTYTISDGNGGTATATVNVTVNPVNDAPVVAVISKTGPEDTNITFNSLDFTSKFFDVDRDNLAVAKIVTLPTNGVLKLDGVLVTIGQQIPVAKLSKLIFTPDSNWNGSTSFEWNGSDGTAYAALNGRVDISITPVNDAPVAVNDSKTTDEDRAVDINVLANDSDIDRDTLEVTAVTQGSHGTVVINSDGTIKYTPNENYNGVDSFTYTISDGNGGTATATVNVTVNSVNDAPVAVDDSVTTDEDTSIDIDVLDNDSDIDRDTLDVTAVTQGLHGTVVINSDGTIKYTPNENYNGVDSFTYTVSDGNGGTSTATVNVTVTPVNDNPVAVDDSVTTDEDTSIDINILDNDSDIDEDTLEVTAVTQGLHGTVVINSDGTVKYTPDANYNGVDSFTYTISDGNGGTATATVNVTVTPVNDAPVAVNDSKTIDEDTSIDIDVLANDSDIDRDTLEVTAITQGSHGKVVINPDGTVKYTPNANYNGVDSFTYTISDGNGGTATATVNVTVNPVNDAPVAVNDSKTTDEDRAVDINVLANDSDIDRDTLEVTAVTQGLHGTVVINPDGIVKYTPDANYNGADSFTYTISDGKGETATATVNITVNPVNDAPVVAVISKTGPEDTNITFNSLDFTSKFSDIDNDSLNKVKIATLPSNGVLKLNGSIINVGDEILATDLAKLTFTPSLNWNGSTSFEWNGSDGTAYAALNGRVDITITPVNDVPIAVNDTVTTDEDTSIDIDVLANDSDIDEDSLEVTAVTQGSHGKVVINPDGTVKYTPNANYNGVDSFTYTVSDGNGGTATATVNVTVNPVNDAPVAVNDSKTIDEDTSIDIDVLANDSDIDRDTLEVTAVTQGSHGTVVINPDGIVKYTPDANYNGADSFTYTISDGKGGTATATVNITVNPVNDAPTSPDYNRVTPYNTSVSGTVVGNDVDNDKLTYSLKTNPQNGYIYLNTKGEWIYTPKINFVGTDSFEVQVSDGHGGTSISKVTVTIKDKLILEGTVTDRDSNKVLPNTKIEIYDLKENLIYSTITDSKGHYIINNVKMGLYEFKIGNSQYNIQTQDIEVKLSSETEYTMNRSFQLDKQVAYSLKLEANPVTIIGDGKSTSMLIAKIVDSNNKPVVNTKVVFSAEIGSFPNGNEAMTDDNGIARVIIKSAKIDGTESRRIPVTATVDDSSKNLHASDRIYITFEPGIIDGVVVDNESGLPISGAVVEASKDFDGDGITDFYTKIITGTDGKYSIAIPKGNMQYNITITKPVKVGNETVQVTYKQNGYAGEVTGAGNEAYSSVNTAAGIILMKDTEGDTAFLNDYSKFTLDVVNKSDLSDILKGNKALETIKGINVNLSDKGVFNAEGLEKGKDYTLAISYALPDGTKIVVGTMNVKVGTDGQINLSSALIDPYGTITDSVTHKIITGAYVRLYYADTERNRASGKVPNTLVNLPIIEGFDPANNGNPQHGDLNGKYAYMVFPDTDYYIVVEKDGYETYISETISVEKEIVKKDIEMALKLKPSNPKPIETDVKNVSIEKTLPKTGSVIDLNSLGVIGLIMLASGAGLTLMPKKKE